MLYCQGNNVNIKLKNLKQKSLKMYINNAQCEILSGIMS